MSPERVARSQRGRLQGAMIEAVARHGYAGTTLRELVALAGVSKSTFYEHFENKQACFFATFDAILEEVGERLWDAYPDEGEPRDRFAAVLNRFMELVVEHPAAAHLVVVESLTLGSSSERHRERGWLEFERIVQDGFDSSRSRIQVSERAVRAIVGAVRGVVYRHLRAGQATRLPRYAGELADMAARFQRRPSALMGQARRAAERPPQVGPFGDDRPQLSWDEPPDGRRCRAALTQRERIVRAAARVVCKEGYDNLSVPAISGAAGVSNQTFYEHFESKRDAFLEAYDILAQEAYQVAAAAFAAAGGGVDGIGAGVRALLEYTAADRYFARISALELFSAGPLGLKRAEDSIDGLVALLLASANSDDRPSDVIVGAIGTGTFAVIRHEVAHDRGDSLPQLAPELAALALTPLA
jgi:AcrR family transcriptional regulator